jgi:hypothetical protein
MPDVRFQHRRLRRASDAGDVGCSAMLGRALRVHAARTGARSASLAGACPSSFSTLFNAARETFAGPVISMPIAWPSAVKSITFRIGKAKAITATARKLAILVYGTLKHGLVYADPGAAAYDTQHRTHVIRRLRQRAENLGFRLIDFSTGELVEGSVS